MENVRKTNLNSPEVQHAAIYNNGSLAFLDNLSDLNTPYILQVEVYVIGLCLQGRASMNINGHPYEACKNDLMICSLNSIIDNYMLSVDFKCYCVCISPDYIQKTLPTDGKFWDMRILFEKNPVCTLLPQEVVVFCQYYDLLCSKALQPSVVQEKVMNALMQAFVYDMQNITNRVMQVTPRSFSTSEARFKSFVDILESSFPKNRKVSFYADELCVTPKYLSFVCKKMTGRTASDLIDLYILKDIEYLMKYSQKTIKEIANELNFNNLTFFGKYTKKHFGVGPRDLRDRYRNS